MKALRTKLGRDLWHHRGQVLSIAAVVATAIMTVLSMRGTYESLETARDGFYAETSFPDLWASVEQAPESVHARLEAIDGVTAVDTRIRRMVNVRVRGAAVPATGLMMSVDPAVRSLGRLFLRTGTLPETDDRDHVVINEKFAEANHLARDSTFGAVINGQWKTLRVVGIAISPEYLYPLAPGTLFPDHETFGIIWMGRQALAEASGLEGRSTRWPSTSTQVPARKG